MATTLSSSAPLLALAICAQLLIVTCSAPTVAAGRQLLQAATCGVTAQDVATAFDAYRSGECANSATVACCTFFVEDLEYSDTGDSDGLLPAFQEPCRTRLREVGQDGVCELVADQPAPYAVLQPLLDRCENLRQPCARPPPPKPCDTSVATVNAAVAVATASLRSCGTDAVTRPCLDQGVPYECRQSGLCDDGSRCSFAPSRGAEIACCEVASGLLFAAVPCLDTCGIYRVSREANNFLTVCTDVSRC